MSSQRYLTGHQARPMRLARAFHQRMLPAVIDLAGAAEAVIERVSVRVRQAPGVAICVALLSGIALSQAFRRR